MRNIKKTMWLVVIMAIVCALTLAVALPASADENANVDENTNVAKIGDTEYATLDAAAKAAKTGDTITLLKDVDLGTSSIGFYKTGCENLTFDLKGHTITSAVSNNGTVKASKVGLIIKNGTIMNTADSTDNKTSAIYVTSGGTTMLENVTLTSNVSGLYVCQLSNAVTVEVNIKDGTVINGGKYGIYVGAPTGSATKIPNITLNVNGGTITGITSYGILANGPGGGKYGAVNVKITGGTISGVEVTTNNPIEDRAAKLEIIGGTLNGEVKGNGNNNIAVSGGTFNGNLTTAKTSTNKITITGGTFNGDLTTSVDSTNNVVITGGTFKGSITKNGNDNITISGGTFGSEVKPEWCAKDFAVKANGDGTYSVKTIYVAKTGDNRYESLAAAISAASNGATVELLTDTTEDVVIDRNITLDLGGFALTGTGAAGKATLTIAKGATATVRNGSINGTANSYYNIQNNGTATFVDLTATAGNTDSSMLDNWGTLTITSGTYTGGLNVVKSEEDSTLVINGGKFTHDYAPKCDIVGVILAYGDTTINGGEFIDNATGTGSRVIVTGVVNGYTSITKITGGTFTGKHNILHTIGKATSDNFKVSGGTFNKKVDESYCADGFIPKTNGDGTYGVKEGQYVAGISMTGYESLADAIKAAKTSKKTIVLLKDIYENVTIEAGQQITLDLNGKTLNGGTGTSVATITNHGTLTITDSVGGGRVMRDDSGTVGEKSYYVIHNIAGTLTIEGGTIYNNSGYKKTNPSGSMVGSSLICNGGTDEKAYLYVKGGTLIQKNFIAIKNDANGIIEVTGGEISSDHSAIQNWFKATITGGKINGQLWTDSWEEGNSVGETVIGGDAEFTGEIVIDITGEIVPTLKITGGTLHITNVRITDAAAKAGAEPAVSGGVFDIEIKDEWCVQGFAPVENSDGTYGVEQLVKIVATEGVLGENIKFYILTNRSGDLKFRIRVTLNGEEVIYDGIEYTKDGKEYYAYILDLPPQYLDTTLKIELVNNDDETIQTIEKYSFLEYCEAVLKEDENAKQLIADLLWYSVAAKNKCGLDSASLVTKLGKLGLVQSTGDVKATVEKSHTATGDNKLISGATLYHDSVNRIIILVEKDAYANAENHSFTYRKADGEAKALVNIGELEKDGITYVTLATEGIYANEFDTKYTIDVSVDGGVIETLVYSVNSYCEVKAESNALAKAIYYYGVSAKAYKH